MKKYAIKFILGFAVNLLAIYMASMYLVNFNYDSWQILLIVSLVFTVIAVFMKPFLKLLSLSFHIFSPIVLFVLYAVILFGISRFFTGFDVGDLKTAIFAGAIIALVNFIAHLFV